MSGAEPHRRRGFDSRRASNTPARTYARTHASTGSTEIDITQDGDQTHNLRSSIRDASDRTGTMSRAFRRSARQPGSCIMNELQPLVRKHLGEGGGGGEEEEEEEQRGREAMKK